MEPESKYHTYNNTCSLNKNHMFAQNFNIYIFFSFLFKPWHSNVTSQAITNRKSEPSFTVSGRMSTLRWTSTHYLQCFKHWAEHRGGFSGWIHTDSKEQPSVRHSSYTQALEVWHCVHFALIETTGIQEEAGALSHLVAEKTSEEYRVLLSLPKTLSVYWVLYIIATPSDFLFFCCIFKCSPDQVNQT